MSPFPCEFRVRLLRLPLLVAALLVGVLVLSGSSLTAAAGSEGPTTVDPDLESQLAASPTGVAAVVTTWDISGLYTVEQLGVSGTRLNVLPMLLVQNLNPTQLDMLRAAPAVRSVYANHSYQLYNEDSSWVIRARETWRPVAEGGLGITGAGVHVAVIDTGAQGRHEDMDNLVEFCEAQQAATSDHVTVVCSPFDAASGNAGPAGPNNDARLDSTDDDGHGSHVSGTVAGSGDASGGMEATHSTIGMAPEANLHVYSANVGPALANHEILAAYDDLIHKKMLGLSEVVAVSNSWGGGAGSNYSPADPIHVAIRSAYDLGILSVFASGNDGPEHNTLSRQCVNPYVVCVAATTKSDNVVLFSSRGRPSQRADTNRDGLVGGPGDATPDNHDRVLAQALDLGLYRPTLAAPGVSIFSIAHDAALCLEGPLEFDTACYVELNGTSMATPHVTGVVALIVEAYRAGHNGATPSPAIITDILERSANVSKMPGYGAAEQGAGRLNAWEAARFASTYPAGLPPVNWGTPTPPFAADSYPGGPLTTTTQSGCTAPLSWSTGVGYGEHLLSVPAGAERLRVTAEWGGVANLYLRLWRPGVDPDAAGGPAGPERVFADQESTGLVFVGNSRWLDVRSPEAGEWTLRVYHRVGDADSTCGVAYNLAVETPLAAQTPSAAITSPHEGQSIMGRFVAVEGTADYPAAWEGITNYEVPGSNVPINLEDLERLALYFQGNVEEGCSGDGATDVIACGGPFLSEHAGQSSNVAATWKVPDPLLDGGADRNIYDPNWLWRLDQPVILSGPMTVEFWAACGLCGAPFSADWTINLWADGVLAFSQRQTASPLLPDVPSKLEITVHMPLVKAAEQIVLQVDPVYIDSQVATNIYYDSALPCPGDISGPCASVAHMPVIGPGDVHAPINLRITNMQQGLRVAWDAVDGATTYDVYRSADPAFDLAQTPPLVTTGGEPCAAPNVPSWPGASDSGLCFFDDSPTPGTTSYYRVVARNETVGSVPSLLAYGTPTQPERQVKVRVDRLWAPRVWEYARLLNQDGTLWDFLWDTLEVDAGATQLAARSFSQGIGSANATLQPEPDDRGPVVVSGGGKVPGETPAAEGVKEATFGLTLRSGAAISGRLNYHDHDAGVRIRAVSFDSLTVANGACSFSGQAEVTRAGQTTVETFDATCEDNSNGGDGDVFTITTESYVGGGALTGGNIKIHD
jgi:serine protease AprX